MRPTFALLILRLEEAFQSVIVGRRFDQGSFPVLVAKDDVTVCIHDSGRPATGTAKVAAPGNLTIAESNTYRKSVVVLVSAIDMLVDQQHAAMVILQLFAIEKVLLFHDHIAPYRPEITKAEPLTSTIVAQWTATLQQELNTGQCDSSWISRRYVVGLGRQ